jgi:hypothetical protein
MPGSYDPAFEADFGDGTYRFRLCGLKEWAELEEKCGAGLFEIFTRVLERKCKAVEIYEPIRLALIGGGLKPVESLKLCDRYVINRPLMESWSLALRILSATLNGPETLTRKKAKAAARGPETDASTPPPSTEPVPSSA